MGDRWRSCFLPPNLFIPTYYTNSFLWHLMFNYMFYHSFAPAASRNSETHALSTLSLIELSKVFVLVRKLESMVIVLFEPATAEGRDRCRLTSV